MTDQTVGELTEPQREFLEIAQNNSRRLVALINDLLDLSRMESGKIELQRKPLNINLLIHELMPSFQLRWEAKRQTFTSHLPEGDPIVLGDAERVTQILSNLLSNAHKYTPDEGHIDLSVETAGSIACVAITDSGIGLSTEEQAQLFTRFYRARNAVTEAVSGTGLGLVITRSLVEMQGGEIQVSSVPGHGSTLRFTLPLAQAPGLPALPRETLLGKRILVVDDDGQGRLLGATDYLYKPIEALDLLQRITPVFAGRSQHLILLVAPDSENHELLACLSILKETKARVYSMAQKQASQHVPNSNERKGIDAAIIQLASIVESSGDAIFGETLQGVITSWNNGAEKLFGYAADEVIGTSVSLIIPPDRQKELPEILARITAGETVQRYETTRMRKDGTHIEVSLTVSPIRDPKGRIMGASTITHDITEQKRMVEELIALNSALEEANRARSQFLSTMSHELRTPLASIIGFSQMLLDDADIANLNQQQHNDLERILKNGQHLLSLINDVLDLTKIEAGRMVVNFSQVDVRDLLTSVVEETQSIAIAQQLVLRAEVDEGMDFLESNPLKLRQVLLNLVSNVLKFTEQGEVTVSARRVISPDQEVEHVAIAVKDSGIGIPADIRAHVFEAFYQADGTYTHKAGGTGLGLSIVSQLTRLLGGTIAVTSAPGQGSTFTVMLPLKAVHHYIEQDPPRLHLAQPLEAPAIPPLLAISRQP